MRINFSTMVSRLCAASLAVPGLLIVVCLSLSACSDDEPVVLDNIVGGWVLKYPAGLQTEGFVEWNFTSSNELDIRVYDVFSGDISSKYDYKLSEEKKSLTISGNIKNMEGEVAYDTFAVYDVVKLTKKELRIKQSWVNTSYEDLAPEDKNVFLLGGYKEESFKRSKSE